VPQAADGSATHELAAGRRWQVTGDGFWQVHPGAADLLVHALVTALQPRTGDHVVDLYSGVGLYAGAFADLVGPGGRVDAVETAAGAAQDAAENLGELPTVHLHHARVDRFLARTSLRRCDLVVLDPPRSGAGADVVAAIVRLAPRVIGYVACDPASLARDVATLAAAGYRLSGLRAFDLFPMTHHVECLAWFQADGDDILISR
jgi:tRNA/tmRNA/rRNA uracil-C5-methylase (TrmA/RlmC/RlmD family)